MSSTKAKNWKSGGSGQRNSVVPVSPSRSIPHMPITPARKAKFLAALGRTGSFTAAARHTDGSEGTRRSYKVLQAKDQAFARACEEALHQFAESVHEVIRKQVFEGNIAPVVSGGHIVKDKDGKEVWLTTKDSRILLNYLKRWKPEFTDAKNVHVSVEGQPNNPADPHITIRSSQIWSLPAHEAEQFLILARKIHALSSEPMIDITPPEFMEAEAVEVMPEEMTVAELVKSYDL